MKAKTLETSRLILKPLTMEHLSQDYVDWLNDSEVYRFLETGGSYTIEMLEIYLKEVVDKDIYFWAIHISDNNLHIGNIKMDPINTRHGLAEYGIMMGQKSEWGKGYAKEASLAVINYCFNSLNIRKLTLGVVTENISAISLYKKLGFVIEGEYIKHGFYEGKYCNNFRMALFNPNFKY